MANIVLVGGQWGDEGKGKIVDALAPHFDIIARYSGGPNAGHTVRRGERRIALHHVPSGILTESVQCVIGDGMVINPSGLAAEIAELEGMGIKVRGRLHVSGRAHLILPLHVEREKEREESLGSAKIGTTLRGVGPAYESKAARTGVRVVDLTDEQALRRALAAAVPAGDLDRHLQFLREAASTLGGFIADTSRFLAGRVEDGASVLFEGAQGALLDLDHGTYPFVTSSSAIAGGACTGTGISPTRIDGVMGVFKAYQTRVGSGPFPTEERTELGDKLRERGKEYGTTTGRPRRCGWFDAVLGRHAVRVNGIDSVALSLLDVLDDFDEIRVCTGYRHKGETLRDLPMESWVFEGIEPHYETLRGWKTETTGCRTFESLPQGAKDYIGFLEDAIECDIDMISVGPEPEQRATREVSKLSAWLE